MIVGGSRWTAEACKSVADFAARAGIPVAASFRRAQLFPADHPNFAGDLGIGPNPKLAARVKEADLLLLVGGRMSETPSSGLHPDRRVRCRSRSWCMWHPGAEELGRVYQPALAIQASPIAFAAKLATLDIGSPRGNAEEAATAHADYLAWSDNPRKLPGRFQYGEVMCWLRDKLPADAIICNGAGNYAGWIPSLLPASVSSARNSRRPPARWASGLPAAVLAKRQYPGKVVVAFAGDGCFLMNGQEFATAVQFGIPFITVVVDNGMYGTIRMHQENHYPHRVSATDLTNPDFAALAKAYGGYGERGGDDRGVCPGVRAGGGLRQAGDPALPARTRRRSAPGGRSTSCGRPRRRPEADPISVPRGGAAVGQGLLFH